MNAASRFIRQRWFSLGLIGLVLLLYAPALRFGLMWDDPNWYKQGEGQSLWQLFTSLDTYQFYRPIAIWLNQQLVAPDGIIAAQTAHFIQLAAHVLAVLAVVPLLSVFKFERRHAQLAALIFALYPLSYQAVAWQAPQQPLATLAVFVAILLAARFVQHRRSRYLIASLAVYAGALLFQESALPFVVMFFWLALLTEPISRST
ncbi:MAG TPA: glycosyltransferase family 39 protein, partial [Anaerolineae bacterium]|nr:glycosyltransferase family 39 protein [Anaerolineae bacterium]